MVHTDRTTATPAVHVFHAALRTLRGARLRTGHARFLVSLVFIEVLLVILVFLRFIIFLEVLFLRLLLFIIILVIILDLQ